MEATDGGRNEGVGSAEGTLQPYQRTDGRIPPQGVQDAGHNVSRMWGKYSS